MWKLDKEVYRLNENKVFLDHPKCRLTVGENSILAKVFFNDHHVGYVVQGYVEFFVDTILETSEGAVGKPVRKTGHQTFIYLSKQPPEMNLSPTGDKEFWAKAYSLCEKFFKQNEYRLHKGHIVAFPVGDKFEILVLKNNKLVYISLSKIFVSKMDHGVLLENKRDARRVITSAGEKTILMEMKF
ncbi:MAG: hypothetical protein DRJ47_05070 [Thermoprotei archaeon]|mgnify:CR=1 FL=1|nr:MAG: hypothetical protein DRJ47_05070 [Thermoprotei archaeon]